MNKSARILLGVGLCLAIAASPALAGNVLSNPGFELDPAAGSQNIIGWTDFGPNTYSETGTNAHTGSNYFKVYQAFTSTVNYNGIYQDCLSGPGATYTADGWAKTLSSDVLAGQNQAWIEVTFQDADANVLALYRSGLITTNAIHTRAFPTNAWVDLAVTNQYNPGTFVITNTVSTLVAPAGTCFVRCQLEFQGDAANSGGSVYFDDITLNVTSDPAYANWNIVWSDEFNGTSINTSNWTFEIGNNGGWGNSELEYYTSNSQNAYVSDGLLHIVALEQSISNNSFTSARMKTEGLYYTPTYGVLQWRAALPEGVGMWPAIWMMGSNYSSVGWPACGEIDVVENNGTNQNFVQGSLHYGTSGEVSQTGYDYFPDGQSTTNFHIYQLYWEPSAITYSVDGMAYETQSGGAPFNQPFFLILNVAVGGQYLGYPTVSAIESGTTFPQEMLIDYVRIYEQTAPLTLSVTPAANGEFLLSWPTNIVAHLQVQQNNSNGGIGTNWINVAQSSNPFLVNPTNSSAFYQLQSP